LEQNGNSSQESLDYKLGMIYKAMLRYERAIVRLMEERGLEAVGAMSWLSIYSYLSDSQRWTSPMIANIVGSGRDFCRDGPQLVKTLMDLQSFTMQLLMLAFLYRVFFQQDVDEPDDQSRIGVIWQGDGDVGFVLLDIAILI
jgi:hypothetical protein